MVPAHDPLPIISDRFRREVATLLGALAALLLLLAVGLVEARWTITHNQQLLLQLHTRQVNAEAELHELGLSIETATLEQTNLLNAHTMHFDTVEHQLAEILRLVRPTPAARRHR
jgi:Tfp pilus assembly protein PilN